MSLPRYTAEPGDHCEASNQSQRISRDYTLQPRLFRLHKRLASKKIQLGSTVVRIMRSGIFAVACLIGSTIAAPAQLATRDLNVFDNAIRRIQAAMNQLQTSLASAPYARSEGEADAAVTTIYNLSLRVEEEIRNGANEVRRGPGINSIEALSLPQKTDAMFKQLDAVVRGYRGAKNVISAVGKKPYIQRNLQTGYDALGQFFDAVLTKVGPIEQAVVRDQKNKFLQKLNEAVQDYRF